MSGLRAVAVGVLLLGASPVRATDPGALLEQVGRYYGALDRYGVEMQVSVHGDDPATPTQVMGARAWKRGPILLQEFAGFLVLSRPDLRLLVDRSSQTIYLSPEVPDLPGVVSTLDPGAAVATAKAAGYRVEARQRPDEVELEFHPPGGRPALLMGFGRAEPQLRWMRLVRASGSQEGPALVSVQYRWEEGPALAEERFEAAHYVRNDGEAWQATESFAGYRVVVSHAR